MEIIQEESRAALSAHSLIVSTAGAYGCEDLSYILNRKRQDIASIGHTIWLVNSNAGSSDKIQSFCELHGARYVVFVSRDGSTHVIGASTESKATHYAPKPGQWTNFNPGRSPVTGLIKRSTTGFWFESLCEVQPRIAVDISSFVKASDGQPLTRFWPSDNAYPVYREDEVRSGRYHVVAIGTLAPPYAVWLQR